MLSAKYAFVVAAVSVLFAFCILSPAASQPAASQGEIASFLHSIGGEWVGTCEQSTDGEQAENKYFHIVNKKVNDNTFESRIDYYRNVDGKPLHIGNDSVVITINANGTATSKITGEGTMLVNMKPKQQKHEMNEVLTYSDGKIHGTGSGIISVSGMPFGVGKNGKILSSSSTWSINKGILTISQTCKAGFKALFITKSFQVIANNSARKGSDLAALIKKGDTVVSSDKSNRGS